MFVKCLEYKFDKIHFKNSSQSVKINVKIKCREENKGRAGCLNRNLNFFEMTKEDRFFNFCNTKRELEGIFDCMRFVCKIYIVPKKFILYFSK